MVASRSGFFVRALGDALCLYVVPVTAALLPWRAGFAWLKALAHWSFLHRDSIDSLWAGAADFFPEADERAWKYRARLLLLVENADTYLTVLRSDRWWRRHITLRGAVPSGAAATLFLTYHWGTGNWIWRVLRAHGVHAHFLAREPHGRSLGMSRLSRWYGALRARTLRRIGCAGVIFTGDSAAAIRTALAERRSVVGMLDLGARADQQTFDAMLLDRPARFPFGLARIAQDSATPTALFSVGLDWRTGQRDLAIEAFAPGATAAQIMARYVGHLDERLHAAPEAWQMWHEARTIFVAAPIEAPEKED